MTLKTYEFTTDLIIDIEPNQNIRFFQNDHNSAHLVFFVTDRKQPVNLTNAQVKIVLQKPDGTIVFQDNCKPIDAATGKFEVILNTQTLVVDGKAYGQIHIEDGDKILECRKFEIFIDRSILSQDAIESTNEFLALQKAIQAGVKLEGIDIDEIVAAGNVVQEVVQAREDENGISYSNLKERMDSESNKVAVLSGYTILTDSYPKIVPESDDTARLKRAINALPEGGKFIFTKGLYTISDALNFKNKKNITIEILGHIVQTKHGYCGIEIESCQNVTVCGNGKIQGYGIFPIQTFNADKTVDNEKSRAGGGLATNRRNGDPGTIPFGGGWEGNPGYGVLIFEGSDNVKVKDIEVFGFNYSGIGIGWTGAVSYNKNIIVTNCNIHNCQDNGISICRTYGVNIDSNQINNMGHPDATVNDTHINLGYGITLLYWNQIGENVVITNNNIKTCKRKGIDAHACKNGLLISSNMIEDCYVYGIALPNNSPTTPWSEFNITNNIVRNSGVAPNYLPSKDTCCGIFADITVGAIISGNNIYNSGRYGILAFFKNYNQTGRNNLVLSGNTVVQNNQNAERGINVYSDYAEAYADISQNSIQSDYTLKGLYVGYVKAANIIGNTAKSKSTPGSEGIGLQAIGVTEGSVSNNNCTGDIALSVQNGAKMFVDNSNVCNGTFSVNSQIKEVIQNAYFIQKNSSGVWTVINRYNPNITATLTVTGNIFKLSFPNEFKVQADIGFMNGPIGTGQIFTFSFNNIGNNYIEIICHDKAYATVDPATVTNGTGFTLSLKFLWKSL
ncbi:BppU family phage baseplate upper protein [Bacillus thuringiensis]|uniref:BppU family phage baseplate upper protein n=1 Tax=Bacillus thuringiensis TaxID=1428 RepID=UPI00381F3A67